MRTFDEPTTQALNTAINAGRIESKNRKRRAQSDADWKEVWLENLEKFGIRRSGDLNKVDEAQTRRVDPEIANTPAGSVGKLSTTEMKLEEVVSLIRKMADNPEKLLESHLGVFVEPAPPGKLLNSQG
jgi:hypothetical protein